MLYSVNAISAMPTHFLASVSGAPSPTSRHVALSQVTALVLKLTLNS